MDDITTELSLPEAENESSYEPSENANKKRKQKSSKLPVAPLVFRETPLETGFHQSTRTCLQRIREAMMQHRWEEAAHFLSFYCQALEDTTTGMPILQTEMIWRMGTEILHHNPNSKMEDYNILYERMKNSGVKHYLVVCLEHAFHFLMRGEFDEAKRQLSIAESWRYGRQSAQQSPLIKLIQAYRGFLDYLIWCDKKATLSSTDDPDAGAIQEMHSYFRQSTVNLKEVMKNPGIWDPFVLCYVDMLEFYNDHDGALKLLSNYCYDSSFPPNPNAHVYLYQYLKKHDAPSKELIRVLKILHALVPSHNLMLEYISLLLQSEKQSHLGKALGVCLDLLDHVCWRNSLEVWIHVKSILQQLSARKGCWETVEELMVNRKDWWAALHFTHSNSKKDNAELKDVKIFVAGLLCPSALVYSYQEYKRYGGASLSNAKKTKKTENTEKTEKTEKTKKTKKTEKTKNTEKTENTEKTANTENTENTAKTKKSKKSKKPKTGGKKTFVTSRRSLDRLRKKRDLKKLEDRNREMKH